MSTVAEIEAAIEQLPPEEFHALKEWIVRRAQSGPGRMWTPEELGVAAQRMVDEPDPVKARVQWEAIMRGFYGDADA
jgi:hypothetical protein